MPSPHRRVQALLHPKLLAAVEQYAVVQGLSLSRAVAELTAAGYTAMHSPKDGKVVTVEELQPIDTDLQSQWVLFQQFMKMQEATQTHRVIAVHPPHRACKS